MGTVFVFVFSVCMCMFLLTTSAATLGGQWQEGKGWCGCLVARAIPPEIVILRAAVIVQS